MKVIHFLIFIGMFLLLFFFTRIKPKCCAGIPHLSLIFLVIVCGLLLTPIPFKNMIEGPFGYLDSILIVATGLIFLFVLKETKALKNIIESWAYISRNHLFFLLLILLVIGMIPGMFTGSALFAVTISSGLLLPILKKIGFDSKKGKAFVIMSGILGMIAPPVNLPLMILSGVDVRPFAGYGNALWIIVVPGVILTALYFWLIGKKDFQTYEVETKANFNFVDYMGIIFVLIMAILRISLPVTIFGRLGWPLIFLAAAILQWLVKRKGNFFEISQLAISKGVHLLGILFASGVFIQITTFTGLKGELVLQLSEWPSILISIFMVIGLVLLGGLWESIGLLFMIPLYLTFTMNSVWFAVISSALIAIGFALPIGWRKPILEIEEIEKETGKFTLIPFGLFALWILFVFWQMDWFINLIS